MKRLQSSSLSDLPSNLLENILSRVPATSFKGVPSTCKRWNALFKDPKFIKKHFDNASKQYLALMMMDSTLSLLNVNLCGLRDNIDPSIELEDEVILTDFNHTFDMFDTFHVFHCDGLLLCTNTSTSLVVWNPCTGQTRWIQTKLFNRYNTYALGYESNKSCRNYKIIRFLELEDETLSELEIYEFNSNSWRVLDTTTLDFMAELDGVSLKGNTYWIAMDKQDEVFGNEFLMMFDFTTERFGERLALPHKGTGFMDFKSLSSVKDERLAVLFEYKDTSTMEIWMTNDISETKAMSWNIFVKADLNAISFLNDGSFFIDQENKVAVCFDTTIEDGSTTNNIVYIIGEDGWRKVNLGHEECCWTRLFSYVPSLAQI